MTARLSTTIINIEKIVSHSENKELIFQFSDFMKRIGTSETSK